jgi:hypothetical protein
MPALADIAKRLPLSVSQRQTDYPPSGVGPEKTGRHSVGEGRAVQPEPRMCGHCSVTLQRNSAKRTQALPASLIFITPNKKSRVSSGTLGLVFPQTERGSATLPGHGVTACQTASLTESPESICFRRSGSLKRAQNTASRTRPATTYCTTTADIHQRRLSASLLN